jgi:hypothetical protein
VAEAEGQVKRRFARALLKQQQRQRQGLPVPATEQEGRVEGGMFGLMSLRQFRPQLEVYASLLHVRQFVHLRCSSRSLRSR